MYRGIIYCYTCKSTHKRYIGQTINEYNRRHDFLTKERYCTLITAKRLSKFDTARKKYGLEDFIYEVIKEFYFEDKKSLIDLLNEQETFYIKQYDTFRNGYNSTTGGMNRKLSKETKNKISNSLKGHKMSDLTKEKLTFKGHKHTDENKYLLSKIQKKRLRNKENHPMFGKHHSEESKLKNSISRQGKCTKEENGNSKSVICYSKSNVFIKEFSCIVNAILWVNEVQNKNINIRQPGQICNCCSGKAKTAYGYIWKYKTQENSTINTTS